MCVLMLQMLAVRRSLTEILLEVTNHEIYTVSQEELARYNAQQGISTHIRIGVQARRSNAKQKYNVNSEIIMC